MRFRDRRLLLQAFLHRSFLNEMPAEQEELPSVSNERLEFLGDAILGFVVADYLFGLAAAIPVAVVLVLTVGVTWYALPYERGRKPRIRHTE